MNLGWVIPSRNIAILDTSNDYNFEPSLKKSNEVVYSKNFLINFNKGIKKRASDEFDYDDFVIENNYSLLEKCSQYEVNIFRLGRFADNGRFINIYFFVNDGNYIPFCTMTSEIGEYYLSLYASKNVKNQQFVNDNYPFTRIRVGYTDNRLPFFVKSGKINFTFDKDDYEVSNFFLQDKKEICKVNYKRLFIFKYADVEIYCKYFNILFNNYANGCVFNQFSYINKRGEISIDIEMMKEINKHGGIKIYSSDCIAVSFGSIKYVNILFRLKNDGNIIKKGFGYGFVPNRFILKRIRSVASDNLVYVRR